MRPIVTMVRRTFRAPREVVFRALLDPDAVARWRFPDGMTCHVHTFEPYEGGRFRVTLTYDAPMGTGKTTAHSDTYAGRFARVVPGVEIVEVLAFESDDPTMRGEMTITTSLADTEDGGTELRAVHEGLPPGVSPADNAVGWGMALDRLAALVERPGS